MRMFRRHCHRAKSRNLSHSHRNREQLNRKRKIGSVGKSRSLHNRNRQPGTQTAAGDAGEAAVVEAGAVVEPNQAGLPDKHKPVLL
jgi:hypothetical protein